MKNIFKYSLVAAVGMLSMSSCKDFLNEAPTDAMTSTESLSTLADAQTALVGVYDAVQGDADYTSYYGADMVYFADVQGDLIQARTTGNRSSSLYEMRYTAEASPAIWGMPYRVISRANNIIQAVDAGAISDGDQESVNNLKGQAMFLRALAHFDLCRVYSRPCTVSPQSAGIPIITEPFSGSTVLGVQSERGTVAEVFDFVIAELKEAATLINNPSKSYGFANSWAAKALLSRAYLYKGDNANALATAKDIIENSPYALWSNTEYTTTWSESQSSELIFEIVNASSADWVDRESIGYLYDPNGYADMVATPVLVDYFEANPDDVRGNLLVSSDKLVADGKVFIDKFPGRSDVGGDSRINNIPILRLSEVYLIAAEAAQKLGDASADGFINEIAKRNPGVSYTNVTLDQILLERGIELFGEGHRKFDLLRNGKEINRSKRFNDYILETASIEYNNDYYRSVLPLPKGELDANSSLKDQQNAGY